MRDTFPDNLLRRALDPISGCTDKQAKDPIEFLLDRIGDGKAVLRP